MRSPQVINVYGQDNSGYSELQVLKSAAGYYIGTLYTNGPDSDCPGLVEPGSRDSDYYETEDAARTALYALQWEQRETP